MTKLFCVYFDARPIWRSDCIEPIQAGRKRTGVKLDMVGDDTGDNISDENIRYGEITAWYWVWKNYLPAHPEVDYIGFCHYRRFLDFAGLSAGKKIRTTYRRFRKVFAQHYGENEISACVRGYDVAMRKVERCKAGIPRNEFANAHPLNIEDWDRFERIVRSQNPNSESAIDAALSTPELAQELQFVMKREVFADFMEWIFSACREFERQSCWHGESEGARARIPAFIIERFFMVWLAIRKSNGDFRVKECAMVKLTGRPWWYRIVKPFLGFLPDATHRRIYDTFK